MDEVRVKLFIKYKVHPAQLRDEIIKKRVEKNPELKDMSKFTKVKKFCEDFWYEDSWWTVARIKKLEQIYRDLTKWEKKS